VRIWLIRGGLLATVVFVLLGAGETAARVVLERQPWHLRTLATVVEPGGVFFQKHPTLGYSHLPGKFTVRLHTGYTFEATNAPDTLRITHAEGHGAGRGHRNEIWIFGCSITYGWSVNDWEAYPWLLQEELPGKEVINFGVNGYGTLHSLIQLREALARGARPELVVLAYGQIHDERNTFTRHRRKTIAPWNRLGPLQQPYARLDGDGRLQVAMADVEYTAFPLMTHSALSHFTEELYNRFEHRALRSREVTLAILDEFVALSRAHGIPVLIAGIRSSELAGVLEWARDRGIPSADISVDDDDPKYVNLPHDPHPSALAHAEYASKLRAALSGLGLTQ
jgi:hypothetical protein